MFRHSLSGDFTASLERHDSLGLVFTLRDLRPRLGAAGMDCSNPSSGGGRAGAAKGGQKYTLINRPRAGAGRGKTTRGSPIDCAGGDEDAVAGSATPW